MVLLLIKGKYYGLYAHKFNTKIDLIQHFSNYFLIKLRLKSSR